MKHISHCAVVSDTKWITQPSEWVNKLINCEVRTFSLQELDEARNWLKENHSSSEEKAE